jgi:cephalosporin hydroxylase
VDLPDPPHDAIDALLVRVTANWTAVRWRGIPLWQNLFDLNVISEHILATRPELIVETGTYEGGSALFYADMMRLAGTEPNVVSIDVAPRATPPAPGVRYLAGRSSADADVAREVATAAAGRRTFVVLDSDHTAGHVYRELLLYTSLVRVGDYLLVQDGNMCQTLGMPVEETPIGGITRFLAEYPHFRVDPHKSHFPTTSHVYGWLLRVA